MAEKIRYWNTGKKAEMVEVHKTGKLTCGFPPAEKLATLTFDLTVLFPTWAKFDHAPEGLGHQRSQATTR